MKLKLKLVNSDIRDSGEFDFVLMGQKNPILRDIRRVDGVSFEEIAASGTHSHIWFLAREVGIDWKNVAYIRFRPHPSFTERNASRITDALSFGVKNLKAKKVAILPFLWRHPEYVATVTVYALWLIGYAASQPYGKAIYGDPSGVEFFIFSEDSVEPYLKVLDGELSAMWNYVADVYSQSTFLFERPNISVLRNSNINISYKVAVL